MCIVNIIDRSFETPWKNLAYETCLLEAVCNENLRNHQKYAVLLLWQNDNTIVIGRNQNPWKECNMEYVEANNIRIARRITGGGAVYHDSGNINFSFILPSDIYNIQKTSSVIVEAFHNLGIQVEVSGRNDILIDQRKFSGNAYYRMDGAGLHHGTILVASDNQKITSCLTPNKQKLKSKGIDSVKSRVVNVNSIYPDVTMTQIKESISRVFREKFADTQCDTQQNLNIDEKRFEKLTEQYSSDNWIYDDYTNVDNTISNHYDWGNIEIKFEFEDEKISKCKIVTDSLEVEVITRIEEILQGSKLTKENLSQIYISRANLLNEQQERMFHDIMKLISDNIKQR